MNLARSSSAPEAASPIVFDSFETTPDFAALREAVTARAWARLEALLTALQPDAASFALSALAEVDEIEGFLEAAATENPHSAFANTALAMRHTAIGWAARTQADVSSLAQEPFTIFYEWLHKAEERLIAVCAEFPRFSPAWSARLTTAKGFQLGKSEAWRRYRHLNELSPHDFPAQALLLQHLTPKWMGTAEEAAAFAFDTADAAPPGSHSGALVAIYHIERWLEFGGSERGLTYMAQPAVLNELRRAADRSVLHSGHTLDGPGVVAHNAFAMAFWLGKHQEELLTHLRLLDGRATEFPWSYSAGKPAELGRPTSDLPIPVVGISE